MKSKKFKRIFLVGKAAIFFFWGGLPGYVTATAEILVCHVSIFFYVWCLCSLSLKLNIPNSADFCLCACSGAYLTRQHLLRSCTPLIVTIENKPRGVSRPYVDELLQFTCSLSLRECITSPYRLPCLRFYLLQSALPCMAEYDCVW